MTSWNGSGVLTRAYDWTDDRDAGIEIEAARMDTEMDGTVAAINDLRDGSEGFLNFVRSAPGTAAAPAFSFTTDTDSGVYRIGADNIGFAVSGTLEASVEAGYFDVTNGLKIGGTAVTATAAELNYLDVTTLGTSEASKAVTADGSGDVTFAGTVTFQDNASFNEELQAVCYLGTIVSLAGTSPTVDCDEGNAFTLTTNGNTTFAFSYAGVGLTTNDYYAFVLRVTAGGAHTLTWPASVDWENGIAPDAPASGETDVYAFETFDGGTNWIGTWKVDAAS